MKKIQFTYYPFCILCIVFLNPVEINAQGFINNGARITLDSWPYIYISGSTGHFTNQDDGTNYGRITVNTGGTIRLEGNWTNNSADPTYSVFTSNATTPSYVDFYGTTAQTIGGSGPTSFFGITTVNTYGTSPQIILGTDIQVFYLTMVAGIYNLAGHTFTLGGSGAVSVLGRTASSTTNWMYGGTLKRYWLANTAVSSTSGGPYGLFPMGESGASSYSPLEINTTTSPTTGGYFAVTYSPSPGAVTDLSTPYNDGGTDIVRVHNSQFIATTGGGLAGGVYDIDVTMTGLSGGSLSDIRLAISTGATTASAVGTYSVAIGTAANPTARRRGLTLANLSNDFRIATTNLFVSPLPIELLSFDAVKRKNEKIVDISWTTASEINNDYFNVERTADGINFETINTTDGAGNSTKILHYTCVDNAPLTGISYYRLKRTDFDGKYEYSDLVAVNIDDVAGTNAVSFAVFPNPSDGTSNSIILTGNIIDKEILIVLHDVLGKETFSKVIVLEESGTNFINVNPSGNLAKGVYIVTATVDQLIYNQRLIIQQTSC